MANNNNNNGYETSLLIGYATGLIGELGRCGFLFYALTKSQYLTKAIEDINNLNVNNLENMIRNPSISYILYIGGGYMLSSALVNVSRKLRNIAAEEKRNIELETLTKE